METRDLILSTITDLVADFLYFQRKEDSELGVGAIQAAVKKGEITVFEMVDNFLNDLLVGLATPPGGEAP
jgi:stalled ribosome alternative rescue factor ArfA